MTTLLPPNASPLERALEDVVAWRLDAVPVPLRDLWDPDLTPDDWLPAQAWGLSVDEWDPAWAPSRQREVIANAIAVQKIKGTIGSIRQALTAAGYPDAVIDEGSGYWRYGDGTLYGASALYGNSGGWATYGVMIPRALTEAQAASVARLLRATAPARCHLVSMSYSNAVWTYGDGTLYGAPTFYY